MGHNLFIDAILEEPNLSYIIDNYEVDLIRDKIQSTDTTIAVWLRGYIPEQVALEKIEHILLGSAEFQRLDVD